MRCRELRWTRPSRLWRTRHLCGTAKKGRCWRHTSRAPARASWHAPWLRMCVPAGARAACRARTLHGSCTTRMAAPQLRLSTAATRRPGLCVKFVMQAASRCCSSRCSSLTLQGTPPAHAPCFVHNSHVCVSIASDICEPSAIPADSPAARLAAIKISTGVYQRPDVHAKMILKGLSTQDAVAHGWFQAASGKVNVPVIVHTALEIAAGMSDLHAHGIVHGDLTGM